MDDQDESKKLALILLNLVEKVSPQDIYVQMYVFTVIEEILGLNIDSTDVDREVYGSHRSNLFTSDGTKIIDTAFLRAIRSTDNYIKKSSSLCLACLLSNKEGKLSEFLDWIFQGLSSNEAKDIDDVTPALCMILRNEKARDIFISHAGVARITSIINKIGANGSAQQLYDFTFCIWTLTLGTNTNKEPFLSAGSVRTLIELVAAAPSRKVFRVSISALQNLASTENDKVLTEMLTHGLHKNLENIIQSNSHKQAGDVEVENDIRNLYDILMKNYRELSTFERWASEVNTGALCWGIIHTEKFWRENSKFLEKNDFSLLKTLISLARSQDPVIVSIALYDIGEFTRFYPNGRAVVKTLGGKDIAMSLIGHSNSDIQRYALQCISKIMVTNWEFMK